MRFFILSDQIEYNPLPEIQNWFGKITAKDNFSPSNKNKHWLLLDARLKEEGEQMDLLTFPCIFVSEKVLKVLQMYKTNTTAVNTILLDSGNKKTWLYYLPQLPVQNPLSAESILDKTHSKLIDGRLDHCKLKMELPFFLLGEVSKATLVIREDVAESLIRRNTRGIKLQGIPIM